MSNDNALLDEIRDRRITASADWDEIQSEAKKDRLCVAGKPWEALDPAAVSERKDTKRPYLALDELGQYINQTVNDVRANPRGIKFAPTGNGANDDGAELYQNHTREIEYRSHARVAYSTAFESAVTSSYGWLRVRTKREHIRTFNQDIWIEPIVNPDQVIADPNAVWPDSRDMKFLYFVEPWTEKEFQRQFPKAKIQSFTTEHRAVAGQWVTKDQIQVAEYWRLQAFDRTLVAFRPTGAPEGSEQFALLDELPDGTLPAGMENVREEVVEDTKVESYLTNGIEILRQNKWKGRYIPFVSCFGKVLYVDEGNGAKRKLLSMTRLARDPYMLYCYIRTCEAEAIGGVPRATWVGYKGQFFDKNRWAKANREPVPYLEAEPFAEDTPGTVLPLPHKEPWDPPLQNLEIAAEAARRAIQAAMGISPLPTAMQRQNQKSGRAMDKIESAQQKGSFHFVDHYELMIERTGVLIEDLITPTLDTARDVPVRLPNDKAAIVRINDESAKDPITTKGDYRVTISTGPATDSQREAADDFVDAMVSNIATIAQIAGPQRALKVFAKGIKIKQLGPEGDELVEILDPPPPNGQDGKPMPPEMQAATQEIQQLKQQLQQAAQTIESDIHKEKAKVQGQLMLEQMRQEFEEQKGQRDSETKITVAEIGAKVERMDLFLQERERLGLRLESTLDRIHEALEADKDRAHDVNMAGAAAATSRAQSAQDHGEALASGEQAHGQALDQQAQAAALVPAPGDEGASA